MTLPIVLIVEDGDEYFEAFDSYLASHFHFVQAKSAAAALKRLQTTPAISVIVLDMRFDRSPSEDLVGDRGALERRFGWDLRRIEQYLMEHQGLFILRHLRDAGVVLPVVLSYDFSQETSRFSALSRRDPGLFYLSDGADGAEILSRLQEALCVPNPK